MTDKGAAVCAGALMATGSKAPSATERQKCQTFRPMRLLPVQCDWHADLFGGRCEINPQLGSDIGKAYKSDKSDNHKDKQKLEEFA